MSRENTNQKIRYLLIPLLMLMLFIMLVTNTIIALADVEGDNGGTGGNSGGTTSGKGGFEDWRQGYRIYVVDGAGTQQAAPVDVLVQYSPDGIPNYETYTRISNLHATEEHTFSELGLDTLGMPVPIYEGTDGAYHANGTTLQTWMLSPSSVNPSIKNATYLVCKLYGIDFANNNWLSGGDRYLILEPITYHKNFESGQWCYGTFWNWMGFYGGSGASNFTASIDKRLLGNGFIITAPILGLNSPVTEEKYWTWNKVLSGNYGVGIHVYYNKGTEEIPETPPVKIVKVYGEKNLRTNTITHVYRTAPTTSTTTELTIDSLSAYNGTTYSFCDWKTKKDDGATTVQATTWNNMSQVVSKYNPTSNANNGAGISDKHTMDTDTEDTIYIYYIHEYNPINTYNIVNNPKVPDNTEPATNERKNKGTVKIVKVYGKKNTVTGRVYNVATYSKTETSNEVIITEEKEKTGYKLTEWKTTYDQYNASYTATQWLDGFDYTAKSSGTSPTTHILNVKDKYENILYCLYLKEVTPIRTYDVPNEPEEPSDPETPTPDDNDGSYNIIKCYYTEDEDTHELVNMGTFYKQQTSPEVEIIDEVNKTGFSLVEWYTSTTFDKTYKSVDTSDNNCWVKKGNASSGDASLALPRIAFTKDGIQKGTLVAGPFDFNKNGHKVVYVDQDKDKNGKQATTIYVLYRKYIHKDQQTGSVKLTESRITKKVNFSSSVTVPAGSYNIPDFPFQVWSAAHTFPYFGDSWKKSYFTVKMYNTNLAASSKSIVAKSTWNGVVEVGKSVEYSKDLYRKYYSTEELSGGTLGLNSSGEFYLKSTGKIVGSANGSDRKGSSANFYKTLKGLDYMFVIHRGNDPVTLLEYKDTAVLDGSLATNLDIKDGTTALDTGNRIYKVSNTYIQNRYLDDKAETSGSYTETPNIRLDLKNEVKDGKNSLSTYRCIISGYPVPTSGKTVEERKLRFWSTNIYVTGSRTTLTGSGYDTNTVVECYSGKPMDSPSIDESQQITATTSNSGSDKIIKSGTRVANGNTITLRPYILMQYDTPAELNKPAYVIGSRERKLQFSDYAGIEITQKSTPNLTISSTQWSTHASALDDEAGRKVNTVLPGGATLTLTINKGESSTATSDGDRQFIKVVTYQSIVAGAGKTQIDNMGGTYSGYSTSLDNSIKDNHDNYVKSVAEAIEELNVQQWIVENKTSDVSDNIIAKSPDSKAVGPTDTTDAKYYFRGNAEDTDASDNGADEGDLDVDLDSALVGTEVVYHTFFTNVYGEVWRVSGSDLETVSNVPLTNMRPNNSSSLPAGVTASLVVSVGSSTITDTKAAEINKGTGVVDMLLTYLERGTGNDETAAWKYQYTEGGVTKYAWYNEAFDGVTIVEQVTTLKVGYLQPYERMSVLDPKLTPSSNGQSDMFSNFNLSQFTMKDYSDKYPNDVDRIGDFRGKAVYTKDLYKLFYTKKFFIPNVTVQDLH